MSKLNKRQKIILSIVLIIMIIILILLIYLSKILDTNTVNNNPIYTAEDENSDWDKITASYITFENNTIKFEGSGATVKDNVITITESGEYAISGNITDGRIIVDANDKGTVKLILNGTSIKYEDGSPIYIKNSNKTIIVLEKDTQNSLSDTENYKLDSNEEPDGTLFSKDDLVINGEGTLIISANYGDAIVSKDDLKIMSGTFEIESNDDGIRGKDLVYIKSGTLKINSKGDAIKSTNAEDETKGTITIDGGDITINSTQDGIQAETTLEINNGKFNITTGGGSNNSSSSSTWGMWGSSNKSGDTTSAKGIKGNTSIIINDGTFIFDTSDDSIHTNGKLNINNGDFDISSGDDAIHADESITIENGNININKSYEGIESAIIDINNGNIKIFSNDDGVNIAGGNDSSAMGRPGENNISMDNGQELTINDGYIYVDSKGDGLDTNGSIYINGGTIIVNGPTDNGNGAIDYDGEMVIKGGTLLAAGNLGMLQLPSTSSTQNVLVINLNNESANSILYIEDNNGNEVLAFAPSKTYQSIIISDPNIKTGKNYNIYTGGSYSEESKDGLYSNGIYTKGTHLTSVTISNVITQIGNSINPTFR